MIMLGTGDNKYDLDKRVKGLYTLLIEILFGFKQQLISAWFQNNIAAKEMRDTAIFIGGADRDLCPVIIVLLVQENTDAFGRPSFGSI